MKKYFVLARSKADAMVPISVRQSSDFEKLFFFEFFVYKRFWRACGNYCFFWVIL